MGEVSKDRRRSSVGECGRRGSIGCQVRGGVSFVCCCYCYLSVLTKSRQHFATQNSPPCVFLRASLPPSLSPSLPPLLPIHLHLQRRPRLRRKPEEERTPDWMSQRPSAIVVLVPRSLGSVFFFLFFFFRTSVIAGACGILLRRLWVRGKSEAAFPVEAVFRFLSSLAMRPLSR